MSRSVLLLGGAGFLGSAVCHQLVKEGGYEIFVLEPWNADTSRLSDIADNVTIIRGMLSDLSLIKDVIYTNGIDTVVHLISTLVPGCTHDEYIDEITTVVVPTFRLMKYCAEAGVLFIFFSSGGTVYGNSKSLNYKFKETDPLHPISYYGMSKKIIEDQILFCHRQFNLKYLILRPSNVYGEGQNLFGRQGLIAVIIGKLLKGAPIEVWGNGDSVRDYININDLTNIVVSLVGQCIINKTLNIGSGCGHSVNDILAMIGSLHGKELGIKYMPIRDEDVNSVALDTSLLESLLDYNRIPLYEGLRQFYGLYMKPNQFE